MVHVICRRDNREKSKVFAQFEAAKAGGADEKEDEGGGADEKEEEVAEKVKKFVAKSDELKKCVMVPMNAALLSNAFCWQGACTEA